VNKDDYINLGEEKPAVSYRREEERVRAINIASRGLLTTKIRPN